LWLNIISQETKMFEKIIANLPYNPTLIKELGFYAHRVRKEESLRRLGLVFIVLAFFVQFFAVISPPKPTLADSTNDMISGGFSSISELVADCNANVKQYATILSYYGLNCTDLANGTTISLVSTSYNKQLFSMGWNPQGSVNVITHKPTDEQPVNITGIASPLYWRYLWSWDTYSYSTYQAVQVKSPLTNKTFFILYACGNLVSVGLPTPYTPPAPAPSPTYTPPPTTTPTYTPPPTTTPTYTPPPSTTVIYTPPTCIYDSSILASSSQCKPCEASLSSSDTIACIQYSKTASDITQGWNNANGKTASPGDKIVYTLTAYNSGKATVNNFVMQDDLSYVLDYANIQSDDNGSLNANDIISWPAATITPNAALTHQITVIVDNPIPQTPPSSSDPEYFDHIMTNIYGNTININLPQTPITTVTAVTTKALPNTGPGDSIIIAAIVVLVAGYFFARSRLLATESSIAIQDNNGGMI